MMRKRTLWLLAHAALKHGPLIRGGVLLLAARSSSSWRFHTGRAACTRRGRARARCRCRRSGSGSGSDGGSVPRFEADERDLTQVGGRGGSHALALLHQQPLELPAGRQREDALVGDRAAAEEVQHTQRVAALAQRAQGRVRHAPAAAEIQLLQPLPDTTH